ncbi:MAG: biosynthetic peptidoglycan transglycosylase [Bacillota bacterium]|nr:biosynthetic peptidoglycan transglycosylase [Bacillota bacterium]
MPRKRGCLSRIFILIIIIGLVSALALFGFGYIEYRNAIETTPLSVKVAQCQAAENYVTIEEISPYFLQDIVAVEDKRFYQHGALDPIAFARAVITNIQEGELSEGGSTITQQVAKNLYFSNAKRFTRKIAEAFVAGDLEDNYSKDEILELYSNIIYFGQSCYGVKAASNTYFAKEPIDLSYEEAAVLAGIPQSPSRYNPIDDPEKSQERTAAVMNILTENGITP